MTKPDQIKQNCEALVKQIDGTLPPDVGVIMLMFNRRTGACFMQAPGMSRKQTDEIFKSLLARPDESSLIIRPGAFKV